MRLPATAIAVFRPRDAMNSGKNFSAAKFAAKKKRKKVDRPKGDPGKNLCEEERAQPRILSARIEEYDVR
jgi:hypothetical protein